jgi:moderate conductance mechanosensitive channel
VPPVPPSLLGPGSSQLAASGGSGGTGGGWLYTLLTKAGVDPSTAQTVVTFVVRPLEILLVLAVAALVARYGARLLRRAFTRATQRVAARGGGERSARLSTVASLVGNVWRVLVAVVAIAIVLGIMGVDLTPLLASATVIGATIGFGAQSLVRDYLSGILLTMEDQYGIGDTITVADATGVVEDLSLRVTRLRAADGSVWYVPNGDIRRLTNASRGWAKAVVDVPVAPGDAGTLSRVREAVTEAAREVAARPPYAAASSEPPEVVGMVAADAGTCTVRVALRTVPARRAELERTLREAVVARLAGDHLWPEGDGS